MSDFEARAKDWIEHEHQTQLERVRDEVVVLQEQATLSQTTHVRLVELLNEVTLRITDGVQFQIGDELHMKIMKECEGIVEK